MLQLRQPSPCSGFLLRVLRLPLMPVSRLPPARARGFFNQCSGYFDLAPTLNKIVDALDLSRATISKVHQNLAWAIAYNLVSIPIAAGILLPQFDFAMTPSLSGGLMALSSIFVVTNSLLLRLHAPVRKRELR